MGKLEISRREMIAASAATVALAAMGIPQPAHASAPLTVQQVLDRMKLHIGGPWFDPANPTSFKLPFTTLARRPLNCA
ncbi:MAG: twin-arginine translocation signal domain-containing protein [Terracidiphilus sp.]|jgi:hypothetical protein